MTNDEKLPIRVFKVTKGDKTGHIFINSDTRTIIAKDLAQIMEDEVLSKEIMTKIAKCYQLAGGPGRHLHSNLHTSPFR